VLNYSMARYWAKDQEDRSARYEVLHERHAPDARRIIEELRGMFIKVAQVLSIRAEIVPETYRREFRKLQDSAPASRWEAIQDTLERDLGAPLGELFDHIDKEPLGSASIGQAHLVAWRGTQAVVKVQYPEAASNMRADFWCLETLLWLVGDADAGRITRQVREQFEIELDYAQEAVHLQGLYDALTGTPAGARFAGRVAIPRPIPELTAGAVIGMEYFPGPKLETVCMQRLEALGMNLKGKSLNDWFADKAGVGTASDSLGGQAAQSAAEPSSAVSKSSRLGTWLLRLVGIDFALRFLGATADVRLRWWRPSGSSSSDGVAATTAELRDTLRLILDVHGFQLFCCPFFNGDPHPGNILMLPDGRVGLIDFGQCKALSDEERAGLARLVLALSEPGAGEAAGSNARIAEAFAATGVRSVNSDEAFLSTLPRLMFCGLTPEMLDREKLQVVFRGDKVEHMPLHMIMAYRTSMLLRGLCLVLQENVSVAHAWRPWAEMWLREHVSSGANSAAVGMAV